ncbi:MAG TPA: 23S rRNA (guanosine(2251)-2'-O)-methyltransferase RlmB [Clostridia bacterium]|nr:23S rRNA (guanosine(2251)-2'-O)-methyltransferase RlmB [Clostridia bacterium]
MDDIIFGRNPVREALRARRPLNKVLVAENISFGTISEIVTLAKKNGVPLQKSPRASLDKFTGGKSHQGVVALASAKEYADLDDLLVKKGDKLPLIYVLDGVSDPQNVGAILRTAEATGANGVIIQKRRAVQLTPVVAKSSAGAIEYVPVARVTNLVQSINKLKDAGFWIAGASANAKSDLWEADLNLPLAIVIGDEGKGIGRLVSESCDFLIRIPMEGKIASLNASAAAAVLGYEAIRQRRDNGG